jgi:hypothetical protein
MSMSKKNFIALADTIREHNKINSQYGDAFTQVYLDTLADFCQSQNPNFMRERWFGYIAGENGKNGGSIKS